MGDGASREGIQAACEAAERHGFGDVWAHRPPPRGPERGRRLRPDLTSPHDARLGRRQSNEVRLGPSVIVVPMRNAVVLAKQLATLDELSGGRADRRVRRRLERGGVREPGRPDHFHSRGAYPRKRSRCAATSGPAVASRSTAGSSRSTTSCSSRCRRRALTLPIWLGGRTSRTASGSGASPRPTTRRRSARPRRRQARP